MEDNSEDRFIRGLIIGISGALVLGFLATAAAVTVMIATNFNILSWIE